MLSWQCVALTEGVSIYAENVIKRLYEKNTSPPPDGGPPPLSGEAIMKIDFRESALFPVEIAKHFSTFCFSLRIL